MQKALAEALRAAETGPSPYGKQGYGMDSVFSGTRVVVAEDDEVNAMLLVELLEFLGAAVSHVDDGNGAVGLGCAEERPDLVLMDCNMPNLDGWAATAAIRLYEKSCGRSRLPIVAITAASHESDRRRCLDVGMDACVTKPYDLQKLLNAVTPFLKATHCPRTQPEEPPK